MDGWIMDKWTVLKKEGVITGRSIYPYNIIDSFIINGLHPLWSCDITHNTSHSL